MNFLTGKLIIKGLCLTALIILAQGMAIAESPFTEKALKLESKIKTSSEAAKETFDKFKESSNATVGKFIAIDLGPFTLTVLLPEKAFPQVSLGITGATKSASISTSGDLCKGQSLKGGGGIYGTVTGSKCRNLIRRDEKTVSVAAGVGAGAGADAASVALTAGGFVRLPFNLGKMLDETIFSNR